MLARDKNAEVTSVSGKSVSSSFPYEREADTFPLAPDKNDGEHEFRDRVHFQPYSPYDASPSERARSRVRGVGGRRGSRGFEARIHHRNPVRVNSLQPAADHELTISRSPFLLLSLPEIPEATVDLFSQGEFSSRKTRLSSLCGI